jgi:alkanesulfonate monooxygenase SsuD/methylene tetrahydromethanopterin reductase-like flavin-dependent oxidoreductase (luciferase family)
MPMFRTALSFDMRTPSFGAPPAEVYPAAFEMIDYADRNGIDQILFAEHHRAEDGYVPVPALMAAAAAARTKRIALSLHAIILPLHDPVEVAEMIAVNDLISGGRVHVVLAAGYVEAEFRAFRRSLRDRAKLMDQGLEVIVRALAGERFMDGDREVFVRPLPLSNPPKIYVGGGVPATARRAAKFGLGFAPLRDEQIADYAQECRALGREPGPIITTPAGVYVARDPDAAWAEIGDYVLHYARSYAAWSSSEAVSSSPMHGLTSVEAVRASGMINVVTPEECVLMAKTRALTLTPLIGGLPPELGWKSLELFTQEVLPEIKQMPPL